jgi:hypothetical protein
MVLCVFLVPFGFFVYLLFGLAGVAGALISAGALTGLIQGGYRLLCRVEVSSRLLKKAAPWGGWETPLDRIEHWSIRRGADHGKSVLNRNPVSLRNDETVEIHLSDQVKPRLLHDFEVSEPGWDQFLGTLRRHIEGKENQFLSSTKGS